MNITNKTINYFKGLFQPTQKPMVILTKEEAIARGINPYDKKGFYTKINGIRVPIEIIK